MSTFDGWETQLYGDVMALPTDDELMHFRTKGSKNGVRRYQTESGEWTPLGLKERKAREGWGQSRAEKKAAKRVAKSERQASRAEKKAVKAQKKSERREAIRQRRSKFDVSKLTDEELRNKIARVKMEQEYKEMTRSPLLKTGERIFNKVLDYKVRKTEAEANKAQAVLDNNRVKADIIKARETTKAAREGRIASKYESKTAASEAVKQKWDTKGGLKAERKSKLVQAKTNYRNNTLFGSIGKHRNNMETYRQTVRMDPYKQKEHQRAKTMAEIALEQAKARAAAGESAKDDKKKKKG